MKQKSLVKNAILNFLYTGLNILFPLITAPYVNRVLGASNLGKVNFATVIVNWFVLFAVFGTSIYGVREVAKVRDDKEEFSKVFSEIFIINGTFSFVLVSIYFMVIFNVNTFNSELPLFLIMAVSIILNMFDIDWVFQGVEEYRYITIRNVIFKIISLICIFLFVTKTEHYIRYGLISVLATSLSRVLNYFYSKRYVKLQFKNINPFRHIKSLSLFFMITFIVNIYTNFDQSILGIMIDTKSVAFMNTSKTVTFMATSIASSISNVTLARASYYVENDNKKFRHLLSEVPNYILWITIPITIGCICLAPNIMYILGGKEFTEATILFQVMAFTIVLSSLSSYIQGQVLIALGREKVVLYCSIITSFVSIILNVILIPKIGLIGAGITQVVAEITAVGTKYYIVKKKLGYTELQFINKSSMKYIFASVLMGAIVIYTRELIHNVFLSFVIGALVGVIVYFVLLLLMREKVMIFILNKFRQSIIQLLNKVKI